jgi:hypothetical protein
MKTMKLKVAIGVAVVVALVAAVPALAATHHGRYRRASAEIPSAPFTAGLPGAAAQAELARSGEVTLPITFSGPGTVLATGEAAVGTAITSAIGTGPEGRSRTIQVPSDYAPAIRPTSVTATAAGTADLTISLTAWARSELAAGNGVEVILSLEPSQGATETVPGLAMFVELSGS